MISEFSADHKTYPTLIIADTIGIYQYSLTSLNMYKFIDCY